MQTRRVFIAAGAAGLASAAFGRTHGMLIHLSCGAIGVKADQRQAIEYAAKYGYDAVDADARFLASLSPGEFSALLEGMKAKKLHWGLAGVPVEFRKDDSAFRDSVKTFPATAAVLQKAGVTRMTTWISPGHPELTFLQNLRIHAARLRDVATVLGDHGLRLGLEYVGPKTSWTRQRYPFVHSMAEMKDLIGEIARPNVGFVLDSWHWYTAGETKKDLDTLQASQVVSVDLNDAPAGIAVDQQIDSKRELPGATGVIDAKAFLTALKQMGFDGPVRAEPFNQPLREMPPDQALATTKAAMDKAFALIG